MVRTLALCISALLLLPLGATGQQLSPATRQKLTASLEKGAAFITSQQRPDGGFDANEGVTAVAVTALLRQPGRHDQALAATAKALDMLRGLSKPDGGIYNKIVPYYVTAVAVSALAAGGRPADKPVIDKGRQYLAERLLDEGEGLKPGDKFYGSLGYGGANGALQGDIISLTFALEAMRDAGAGANDPSFAKAINFLQRTQNSSESNTESWAKDDGGFIYYPGTSVVANTTESYGSGTYAGMMSYLYANLKKTDLRVQGTLKWVRNNYTLDENPGIGQKTLYYYYMVFAKALRAAGEDVIVDARGRRHNWREELAAKLISLQKGDGSWVNSDPTEMQNNKVLVTAFTMMAIEATLQ
jgi:squalene-hopene/tetraprenyl-beta-curcumene cyclase